MEIRLLSGETLLQKKNAAGRIRIVFKLISKLLSDIFLASQLISQKSEEMSLTLTSAVFPGEMTYIYFCPCWGDEKVAYNADNTAGIFDTSISLFSKATAAFSQ